MIDTSSGWTAQQVRDAEQPLLDAGEPLMARAAAGLADEVRLQLAARAAAGGRVVVLAGSGSNGGDALLALATVLSAVPGATGVVVPLGSRLHEGGLAAAREAGAVLQDDVSPAVVAELAAGADVVLDAVLGTGAAATPALRPPASEVVQAVADALAASRRPAAVVAVDLPSGIGPDDGSVHPPVLPAAVTVTFGAVKAGLLLPPASALAGRIVLIDIGLGPALADVPPVVRG